MKRKIGHEKKTVFLTNTIGLFILSGYFLTSESTLLMLLGLYSMYSLFCFLITSEDYLGRK